MLKSSEQNTTQTKAMLTESKVRSGKPDGTEPCDPGSFNLQTCNISLRTIKGLSSFRQITFDPGKAMTKNKIKKNRQNTKQNTWHFER